MSNNRATVLADGVGVEAFRCQGRQFCPSCHARRLAEWSLWLDERLLAAVPHRQVVLTVPKRFRAYFLCDRRRLSLLSRVAYCTSRDYLRAALDDREAAPGAFGASTASARWSTGTLTSMCS